MAIPDMTETSRAKIITGCMQIQSSSSPFIEIKHSYLGSLNWPKIWQFACIKLSTDNNNWNFSYWLFLLGLINGENIFIYLLLKLLFKFTQFIFGSGKNTFSKVNGCFAGSLARLTNSKAWTWSLLRNWFCPAMFVALKSNVKVMIIEFRGTPNQLGVSVSTCNTCLQYRVSFVLPFYLKLF